MNASSSLSKCTQGFALHKRTGIRSPEFGRAPPYLFMHKNSRFLVVGTLLSPCVLRVVRALAVAIILRRSFIGDTDEFSPVASQHEYYIRHWE